MKEILLTVMQRLKEQVPDLAYIAEDWGQMDYYNDAPPVKFPCALISVNRISFESETWGVRRTRLTFLVRIADCPVLMANMAAPEQHRKRAFAVERKTYLHWSASSRVRCSVRSSSSGATASL